MTAPQYNPGEPYMLQIPGGFTPGRIAHVTGTFKPNATSFIMKFQSGPSGDPTDEIGLCIYGRLLEGVIGRNAFTRTAGWGVEEASNSIALAQGQNFDVTILCDQMSFKIALNQQHFAEYNHRANPASMTYLNVASTSQDVTLGCVWVEDPVPPPTAQPQYMAPGGVPGPYPPQPNYGPPPPYSGGPGYAPPLNANQQYQQQGMPPGQYGAPPHQSSGGMGTKGLLGMAAGAGGVAGVLSHGVSQLLGGKSKSHGGYPGGGYPGGGYPGYGGGSHGGGGGLLNKAMAVGGTVAGAKMLGKSSKAMKYGVPLAGLGALAGGGYMMHKGFHGGSSSSSGGSSEEE